MRFTKMHGAGNDFVVLDAVEQPLGIAPEDLPGLVYRLCDRHTGVGADGVMVLQRSAAGADVAMRFYNSDGSLGEMCGNGARCVCRYACERGYADDTVRVETTAGLVTGWRQSRDRFRIRLNTPTVLETERALTLDGETYCCGYAELGNPGIPHLTVEIPDLLLRIDDEEALGALRMLGRKLRYHPAFPKGANVNFLEKTGENRFYERTWERGVEDFTYACGTGTGASVYALAEKRRCGDHAEVEVKGGLLIVDIVRDGKKCRDLLLTGPASMVCTGEIFDEAISQ